MELACQRKDKRKILYPRVDVRPAASVHDPLQEGWGRERCSEWGERGSRNRPGHHCGGAAFAQQAVFFQSAYCLFICCS